MSTYTISFFQHKLSTKPSIKNLDFDALQLELHKYLTVFSNRNKDDLPVFTGGLFEAGCKKINLKYRSLLVYDLDRYRKNWSVMLEDIVQSLQQYKYIYYTTFNHTETQPKVRIILFPDTIIATDDFTNISINVANSIFSQDLLKAIDKTSHEAARRMYVPVNNKQFSIYANHGDEINVAFYVNKLDSIKEGNITINSLLDITQINSRLPLLDIDEKKVRETLKHYPSATISYDEWRDTIFAVHHQFEGAQIGFDILKEWALNDNIRTKDAIIDSLSNIYYNYAKLNNDKELLTFATVLKRVKEYNITHNKQQIVTCSEDSVERKIKWVDVDKKGKPLDTPENLFVLLNHYNIKCSFDVVLKKDIIEIPESSEYRLSDNTFDTNMNVIRGICNRNHFNIYANSLQSHLIQLIRHNKVNPFRDFILNLKWDGQDRLNDFYNILKVDPAFEKLRNVYLKKFLKQLLCVQCFNDDKIALPARQVLILQGAEHIGKSTFLMNLIPENLQEYFTSPTHSIDFKNAMDHKLITSAALVELAEIESTISRNDSGMIKSFIGAKEDKINIKYMKDHLITRRLTVYCASVNDASFLNVHDSHTRFLILPAKKISRTAFDIVQIYAQLVDEIKAEIDVLKSLNPEASITSIYELSDEERKLQITLNKYFQFSDIYVELITAYIDIENSAKLGKRMTATEILTQLKLFNSNVVVNNKEVKALAKTLKRFNFNADLRTRFKIKFKSSAEIELAKEETEVVDNNVTTEQYDISDEINYQVRKRDDLYQDLLTMLHSKIRYGLDIETTGLDYRNSKIALLQIYSPSLDVTFIYKMCLYELTSIEKHIMSQIHFVAHNAAFEQSFLPFLENLDCSMLAYHAATSDTKCSLANLAEHTNIRYDNKKEMQLSDWTSELTNEQLEYAAKDAKATYALWQKFQGKNDIVYNRMKSANKIIQQYAKRGLPIDLDALTELKKHHLSQRDKLLEQLRSEGFQHLITDENNIKTKQSLFIDVPEHVLNIIKDVRSINALINNQIKNVEENITAARLSFNVLITGTETGRLATTNPNVQNLPRQNFRHIIKAQNGCKLIKADFAAQELRMVAAIANEKNLLDIFDRGDDPHLMFAAKLNNISVDELLQHTKEFIKHERQKAKAANFGFLYGMGAERFKMLAKTNYNLDLTLEEATVIKNMFWSTYPTVKYWSDQARALCDKNGFVETRGGRKRFFIDSSLNYCEKINTIVQGSCADALLETLIALPVYLQDALINTVHDELVFEISNTLINTQDKLDKVKNDIINAMKVGTLKIERKYPTFNICEIKVVETL